MRKSTMNEDIKKYPVFVYGKKKIIRTERINSTEDYNHYTHNLHHYIPKQQYDKNPEWYVSRGIEQKLILVPIAMHEQIHEQAISNLDDDDFYGWYGIDRWELIFNRKYSKY